MLEIVVSASDKLLLTRSNLFSSENILDFCLLLSYGKFDKDFYNSIRIVENYSLSVSENINELNEKLKDKKEVRIWYSAIDNEDVCTLYFLVNYLQDKNIPISICNVQEKNYKSLSSCAESEIKNLIPLTKKLTEKEITFYSEEWNKLFNENAEIRYSKNGILTSGTFEELDNEILKKMPNNEIKYFSVVANCMQDTTYGVGIDMFFINRINQMIKENKIIITKEETTKDIVGNPKTIKYIKKKYKSL